MVKEDFVKDRWYKTIQSKQCYTKYNGDKNFHTLMGTEHYYNNNLYTAHKFNTWYFYKKDAIECTLEDLKSFLPNNHPDLLNIAQQIYELW